MLFCIIEIAAVKLNLNTVNMFLQIGISRDGGDGFVVANLTRGTLITSGTLYSYQKDANVLTIMGKKPEKEFVKCLIGCCESLQSVSFQCIKTKPPQCVLFQPKYEWIFLNLTSFRFYGLNLLSNELTKERSNYDILF